MTPDELRVLADRAVACRDFRPMAGMRDLQGRTWTPDLLWRWNRTVDRPDLTDPATLGCLLALVREAWVCGGVHARRLDGCREWTVKFDGPRLRNKAIGKGLSEAEALVAALEAAP